MRKLFGTLAVVVLVAGLVSSAAPAAPFAASVRCLQISPSDTPGSCTYRSTVFETETLSAFALGGFTLDWVEDGLPQHLGCAPGPCNEPNFTFTADAGTTIRVTVTQGVVLVRQVVAPA